MDKHEFWGKYSLIPIIFITLVTVLTDFPVEVDSVLLLIQVGFLVHQFYHLYKLIVD